MGIKINCIYNDQGAWCTNKKIKRSLFGLGARCCVLFPYSDGKCDLQKKYKRSPIVPPPQPPKRRINENILVVQIEHKRT